MKTLYIYIILAVALMGGAYWFYHRREKEKTQAVVDRRFPGVPVLMDGILPADASTILAPNSTTPLGMPTAIKLPDPLPINPAKTVGVIGDNILATTPGIVGQTKVLGIGNADKLAISGGYLIADEYPVPFAGKSNYSQNLF